jgi:hypothetical protein
MAKMESLIKQLVEVALEAEIESHLSQELRKRKNCTAYITRRDRNNIAPATAISDNYTSGVKARDLYNTSNKSFLSKNIKRAISADGVSGMPEMGVVV